MTAQATKQRPVKLLAPKVAEAKFVGTEPTWVQFDAARRREAVIKASNWYNYSFGTKEAKEFTVDWLDRNGRQVEAKRLQAVGDREFRTVIGWLCRMNTVGLELTQPELEAINQAVVLLLSTVAPAPKAEKAATPAATIQDRLREKMSEAAADLEGMYDDFLKAGCKMASDMKPVNVLRGLNVVPAQVPEIVKIWTRRAEELTEVQSAKDSQLVEAYSCYGKIQIRNMLKFAELVLADCASYLQLKKVERKPRAKKPVSKEKLVARLKYMREDVELKIKSEHPSNIIGASELWLYDTKKRKLMHYVADSHMGSFTVKGNMLVGFDAAASTQKTLRTPQTQLVGVMGSRPLARKHYNAIKAVESKLNGRFNENIVILRVN